MNKRKWTSMLCMVLTLMIACMAGTALGQVSNPSRLALVNNPTPPGETPLMDGRDDDAEILFVYQNGTPVTVYDDYADGWSRVEIGTIAGYIQTDLLLDDFPEGIPFEVPVVKISNIGEDDVVNLRELPFVESNPIGQYPADQEALVLGESDAWYHVSIDGQIGFMDTTFLLKTDQRAAYTVSTEAAAEE